MGDSNAKDITFGSGHGRLGEEYLGKHVKAARIKDIDPSHWTDYAIIVLVCSTNDLWASLAFYLNLEPKWFLQYASFVQTVFSCKSQNGLYLYKLTITVLLHFL